MAFAARPTLLRKLAQLNSSTMAMGAPDLAGRIGEVGPFRHKRQAESLVDRKQLVKMHAKLLAPLQRVIAGIRFSS